MARSQKGEYLSIPDKVLISEAEISLVVNEDLYKVRVQSNWTLQYVLHNELGLIGTKKTL